MERSFEEVRRRPAGFAAGRSQDEILGQAPIDTPPACLAAFDEIERRWREALALVHAGEPTRAQREVEAAGELIVRLGELEQMRRNLDPARLADLAERMARLSALHHELSAQSRRAREEIVRELESMRNGRDALEAYASGGPRPHACDEVG